MDNVGYFLEGKLKFCVTTTDKKHANWIADIHENIPKEMKRKHLMVVGYQSMEYKGIEHSIIEYIIN